MKLKNHPISPHPPSPFYGYIHILPKALIHTSSINRTEGVMDETWREEEEEQEEGGEAEQQTERRMIHP
ncbi:hypothetical protein Pmani_002164 [Petrolisthes manimaculis]|uniref:Uncharacterized protein n=1 Tax=Petrolisthes manimaculis TaxID=1843537 RepID=A0AAE1UKM8_9EUCA|nr:hypothetical protein Pmani_032910 [Petrolisthes manimaculis]KAK4327332.1 hypothetical protein Pmani_002164 [Petrolisthes manimaculis]